MTLVRVALLALALLTASVPLMQTVSSATAAEADAVTRDPRFGLNDAFRLGDRADSTGAGWSRILFWWSEMQKGGPGDLDLFATDQDRYITDEANRGRQLAGAVLNVPTWASSDGSRNGVPKNLNLAWDHPDNHWGQFMRKMAQHYRGKVDTWIIWNEIDIDRSHQWNTWHGTLEEYVQLQKVAYRAIKAGNPDATVLPFGAAWWYDRGATLTRMLDLLAADPDAAANNYYFDVANLHLYSRADDIPRIIAWYREQLAARGMQKPIWIGETNAIPYDDPLWVASKAGFRASQDEQAAYMIQAFATYLGLGIERIGVNRSLDGTDFEAGGEPFGLVRNDGSTRPAFTAYQVVTRYFAGARDATYEHSAATGITRVAFARDNEQVTVLWTMRPAAATATVEARGASALTVNKFGETATITPQAGAYGIQLAPATANSNEHDRADYVVGGDPVILVERIDGGTPAARPLSIAPRPAADGVARTAADAPSTARSATPIPTPKKR